MFEAVEPLRRWLAEAWSANKRVALVPTMGALHDGHGSLVQLAREHADLAIASVFVNPTQFGPQEDLASYPRDLVADAEKLSSWGAAALFCPAAETLYPAGLEGIRVHPAPALVERLCGPQRPGHFAGVLTIVLKLLTMIRPDVAVFGQKDYQQFRVISQMVEELFAPVELICAPIVREADGLAMSSRNAYLSPAERVTARALSRTLGTILRLYQEGDRRAAALREAGWTAWQQWRSGPGVPLDLEYLEVLDGMALQPVDQLAGEGIAAIAAHVGKARLIDNVALRPNSPDLALLRLLHAGEVPRVPNGEAREGPIR
ncbi:MAG: pantoate--beta-alanine ligase [Cyanobacteria bacterium REEB65]|nr:pantoate--beta-alanine ligase [Cyanobacteria bacterium REEB65]